MALPVPSVESCYFCEILDGRADPWNVIAETERTMTVLNGRQFEIGQCIVVTRRHAPTLLDLRDEEAAAVMSEATRVAQAFCDAFAPDGILVYQNNGIGSGQEVPHFHLHVVPRTPSSDWGFGPPHIARFEREGRRPQHDYRLATAAKLETADMLRRRLGTRGT